MAQPVGQVFLGNDFPVIYSINLGSRLERLELAGREGIDFKYFRQDRDMRLLPPGVIYSSWCLTHIQDVWVLGWFSPPPDPGCPADPECGGGGPLAECAQAGADFIC